MEKLGSRNSVLGPWFSELGSGKVAGKVLIVDQYAGPANILILLETVIEWCLGKASNPAPGHHIMPIKVTGISYTITILNQLFTTATRN